MCQSERIINDIRKRDGSKIYWYNDKRYVHSYCSEEMSYKEAKALAALIYTKLRIRFYPDDNNPKTYCFFPDLNRVESSILVPSREYDFQMTRVTIDLMDLRELEEQFPYEKQPQAELSTKASAPRPHFYKGAKPQQTSESSSKGSEQRADDISESDWENPDEPGGPLRNSLSA